MVFIQLEVFFTHRSFCIGTIHQTIFRCSITLYTSILVIILMRTMLIHEFFFLLPKKHIVFFRRIMFSALVVSRFIFVSVFNFQKRFSIDGILYGIRVIAPYRNYCLYHNFLLVFDLPELSPTSFLLKRQWHAPNQLMQRIATTHSLKIENVFFSPFFLHPFVSFTRFVQQSNK